MADADAPMSAEETKLYEAIINGAEPPDPVWRKAGRDAHEAGAGFGEGPRPFHSVAALSWRFGWNERALEQRDA